MTEVSVFYKDTFPCNRLPGHSKCQRKVSKNKCPGAGAVCVSRQMGTITFWPKQFFEERQKVS